MNALGMAEVDSNAISVIHTMSQVLPRNGTRNGQSFHGFFERWLVEQNHYLDKLVSASKESGQQLHHGATQDHLDRTILRPLIERVIHHYEHYYKTKSSCAKNDVLAMFSPSWTSSLEDAFLWIGGWRPSMAFHLLYSVSGAQVEEKLMEFIRGLGSVEMGLLRSDQLEKVSKLQEEIIGEERRLTEKLAKKQESVADSAMVELSHAETELAREGKPAEEEKVEAALGSKEEGLTEILEMADELRLRTLKEVLGVVDGAQGVQFLIAAAELHLRFHEWGKRRDAAKAHDQQVLAVDAAGVGPEAASSSMS